MPALRWSPLLALLAAACIQSKHGTGAKGPPNPGGEVRLLENRQGRGRIVLPGDRYRVEFTGKYENGEVWGRGTLTLIYGDGMYPGAPVVNVGAVERLQYVVRPSDTTSRLVPFQGDDSENEAYQVRHDRGQIIIEHKILTACHPLKIFVMQTGFGPIEADIGCWRFPRRSAPSVNERVAAIERMIEAGESGEVKTTGTVLEPPVVPRKPADTARYSGEDGLHLAAREARPEIVSWLIEQGRDPNATDSLGFAPIHYVGFAQRPLERFVPALEQSYLDVVDTLLSHGAQVDARVQPGVPRMPMTSPKEDLGQTALSFAAAECADRLVAHLLERGADANAHGEVVDPPIIGAARNGCPGTVRMLLEHHAQVDYQPRGGGTPLERLIASSAFHEGHFESARLLVLAGAKVDVAAQRLNDRLDDPGPGGFGFSNRPQARRILRLLRAATRR